MRRKMIDHLASGDRRWIDLKQDPGGLVDIEFLAQYARLRFHVPHRATAGILRGLPGSAPTAWREAAPRLADLYLEFRRIEFALRVELWASPRRIPTRREDEAWETLRRHCRIATPDALRRAMEEARRAFLDLLEEE